MRILNFRVSSQDRGHIIIDKGGKITVEEGIGRKTRASSEIKNSDNWGLSPLVTCFGKIKKNEKTGYQIKGTIMM